MVNIDMRKKLADGEHYRKDLPTAVYELARYIAPAAADNTTPEQLVMLLAVAQNDIITGYYMLNRYVAPPYFLHHRREVLKQAKMILFLIDKITDASFAMAVRRGCQKAFDWALPVLMQPIS